MGDYVKAVGVYIIPMSFIIIVVLAVFGIYLAKSISKNSDQVEKPDSSEFEISLFLLKLRYVVKATKDVPPPAKIEERPPQIEEQ